MFISDAFAATAANSSAPAAKGVFPPFDVSTFPAQLFWLVITFGTLYFVMSRIALPRVAKILDTRRLRIGNDLDVAAAARLAAQEGHDTALADQWQKLAEIWRDKQLQYTWLRAITGRKTFDPFHPDGLVAALDYCKAHLQSH